MTKRKAKRPRKPRPFSPDASSYVDIATNDACRITATAHAIYSPDQKVIWLHPREARRLAKWLLAFSAWSDAREGK